MKKIHPAFKPDFFSTQVSQARCFYLNLKPSTKNKLVVVCGGVEHCVADYAIDREYFPFYSIEFVFQGSGHLKLNHSEYVLEAGSVFSYGFDVPHHISTNSPDRLIKYFIDFAGYGSIGLLRSASLKPGSLTHVFPAAEIQPLFEELIRNGQRGTPRSPDICGRLLEALVLKISDARAPLPGSNTLAFSTYQLCRNHIDRHFLRLRSLGQIASECRVDRAYLCRLFQKYDHQSPYHLLTRLKMSHAAERLQSPGTLVKQIAEETGFANPFHFSRVFKSVFGTSPRSLVRIR
jgi:AraC-like DNA-binding protein